MRNQTRAAAVLSQLIDQRLVALAAADVEISEAAVADAVAAAWRNQGFSDEDSFRESLGEGYDDFLGRVHEQLQVAELLRQEGITDVSVSREEAMEFYVNNPNSFLVSERVHFRQLFINFERSGGRDAAADRLSAALEEVQSTDFCAVVRRTSDDTDSRDRCGEYTASRGILSPEIEASIFSLEAGEQTVLDGGTGFHIIQLLAYQPTSVIPFAEAEAELRGLLRSTQLEQRLSIYLLRLRADAEIVDYT